MDDSLADMMDSFGALVEEVAELYLGHVGHLEGLSAKRPTLLPSWCGLGIVGAYLAVGDSGVQCCMLCEKESRRESGEEGSFYTHVWGFPNVKIKLWEGKFSVTWNESR